MLAHDTALRHRDSGSSGAQPVGTPGPLATDNTESNSPKKPHLGFLFSPSNIDKNLRWLRKHGVVLETSR